ncbi:MAG TPA: 2-hydroxyacyl-CoA dehydratase [Firmicutes bacterium]|nr:2-hydroxyacyl-CoA dehydratase [Bacillota bacterium]HBM71013.1 2-hydroxyacyl-CoA dehydratase [Bacillota bacterium]HBX24761.1 2-hydroxyacyl-CoA dehydratase [Bacillota bacterium]
MRDLKHLYYFEKLLENSYNDLIGEAQNEGRKAIGHVCYQIPEPLLNLPGIFSVRLRAPRTGSMEMGSYYLSPIFCEACRAILERALEGGFNYLDAIIAPEACAMMNRCVENIEHLNCCTKPHFFASYVDVPMKSDESTLKHYVLQMKEHVLKPLHENLGIDVSDQAIRKAVEEQNKISKLITEIGDFRKEERPRITGYEFAVLTLATYCCPKDKLITKLEETLEEIKNRVPEEKGTYRCRVAMVGSEIDDPQLIKLAEECGLIVVADRYCFGSLPGRQVIELNEKEDALTQVCSYYMHSGQCPRFLTTEKVNERHAYIDKIGKEYHVDGLIIEQIKFCDYWGYGRAFMNAVMQNQYGYKTLSIDRPYNVGQSGQLRTRIQAFIEALEIKKIQEEKEAK